MPKEESHGSLESSIEEFRVFQNDLLDQISNIPSLPREKIITLNYQKVLDDISPWYSKFKEEQLNCVEAPKPIKIADKNERKEIIVYIKEIKSNPKQKKEILIEFFNHMTGMDESDKTILIENFGNLTDEQLELEMINLAKLFT